MHAIKTILIDLLAILLERAGCLVKAKCINNIIYVMLGVQTVDSGYLAIFVCIQCAISWSTASVLKHRIIEDRRRKEAKKATE